jgi:zinc protease
MDNRRYKPVGVQFLMLMGLLCALPCDTLAAMADMAPNTVPSTRAASKREATAASMIGRIKPAPALEAPPSTTAEPKATEGASAVSGSVSKTEPVSVAPTSETVLPNGLKVIFLEDHSFPVVSCLSWYRVGARNERPGATGITHLLEHLVFGEVGSFRQGEIAAQIARVGGQFNGYTSDDFTTFFETLPPSRLELALKIESERMRRAVFTEKALKEEVANIEREIDNEASDPTASLNRQVRLALFTAHPYRTPVVGLRPDIENVTIQQVRDYYDRYYRPNNCTVVIAGDIKPRAILPLLVKYFAAMPKSPEAIPQVKAVEPEQKGERPVTVKYNGKQETLEVAYHVSAFDADDTPALVVLERLLNCAYSGRLKTRLVATKVCSQSVASFEAKKDPGIFSITCQSNPNYSGRDAQQKINDAVDDLIQQLKSQPISDAELRRARNQAELAYFSEQDGPYRAGFLLGYFETLASWRKAAGWPERLRSVTAGDIQQVARKYFNSDNRVVAWLSGSQVVHPAAPATKPNGDSATPPAKVGDHARMTGYKEDSSALAPSKKQTFDYIVAQSLDASKPSKDTKSQGASTEKRKITGSAAVKKVFKDIPAALPTAVKDLPTVVEKVPTVLKSIPSAIGGIPGKIKEIPAAVTSIPSAIKQIPGAIGGIPGAAVSAVKDLPSAAATTIKELPGTVVAIPGATVNAVKGMPNALGSVAAQVVTAPGAIGKQLATERNDKAIPYKRTLKNGVKVLVFESHLVPVVQIDGAFHAGSAYDPADRPGTSALCASILNQGSATCGRMRGCLQQEDLGLAPVQMLRFQNGVDNIKFTTTCLARDMSSQLSMLADTLTSPALQDGDLDRARQEAMAQTKQLEDTLETRAERTLMRSVLSDSSPFVPREPQLVAKSMAAADGDAVRKFLSERVVPGATTIVIAGDVDSEKAVAAVEKALSGWSGKAPQQRLKARSANKHVLRAMIPVRDKTRAAIAFGQLVPVSRSTPDYANLLIADAVLNKHPVFSRLNRKLAADSQLAQLFDGQSSTARMEPLSNAMSWAFIWSVEPDAVPLAVSTLQAEMYKLSVDGIKPEELSEMKRYLLGALPVNELSTLAKTAETVLDTSIHADDGDTLFAELNAVRNATVDSVNKFIKTAMNPDDCTLVVVGPSQAIRALHARPEILKPGAASTPRTPAVAGTTSPANASTVATPATDIDHSSKSSEASTASGAPTAPQSKR